jgi:hypothetical protein
MPSDLFHPTSWLVREKYQIANLLSPSFFAILMSLKEIRAATV